MPLPLDSLAPLALLPLVEIPLAELPPTAPALVALALAGLVIAGLAFEGLVTTGLAFAGMAELDDLSLAPVVGVADPEALVPVEVSLPLLMLPELADAPPTLLPLVVPPMLLAEPLGVLLVDPLAVLLALPELESLPLEPVAALWPVTPALPLDWLLPVLPEVWLLIDPDWEALESDETALPC